MHDTEAYFSPHIKGRIKRIHFIGIGCAGMGGGLGSTAKTNQLELGMSTSEVKNTLGEPSQTQFIVDKWGWNYSLHQYWKFCSI